LPTCHGAEQTIAQIYFNWGQLITSLILSKEFCVTFNDKSIEKLARKQ